MIKVDRKMTERFIALMEDHDEFVFGDLEQVRKQLEVCLNSQGYWSGCAIRVFYDEIEKDFYVESRY